MATVRIPPTLRSETNGQRQVQAVGDTVGELLDDVIGRFPGLQRLVSEGELAPFVNVYVEGQDVRALDGLDTPVQDGSTVILLPAMAGGTFSPQRSRVTPQPHDASLRSRLPTVAAAMAPAW